MTNLFRAENREATSLFLKISAGKSGLKIYQFKGFAMPPTPFLGSGASFQGPGPLPMASARRAIGISLIESFWRAIGAEIDPFS